MASDEPRDDADQPSLDELITLKEAAALCELSYSHLRRLARDGRIWARKLGHNWFTTEQAVQEYLASDRRPGPKPNNPGRASKND